MRKKFFLISGGMILLILALRFFLGGDEDRWLCKNGQWVKHGHPSYPRPIVSCNGITPLPQNEKDCLAQGGIWKRQGVEPRERCNRKTIDDGHPCRDNNECEGWCRVDLTQQELSLGMMGKLKTNKKSGRCSRFVVELGCFGMMEKGKTKVICID